MKLITTTIPDDVNNRINRYIETNTPSIYNEWENGIINRLFGSKPNMNEGIYKSIFFDNTLFCVVHQVKFTKLVSQFPMTRTK
jgi:hypothetical protein